MPVHLLNRGSMGGETRTSSRSAVIAGNLDGKRILAPLLTSDALALADQIKVATTLAKAGNAALQITNPVTVPEQTPLALCQQVPDEEDNELLDWAVSEAERMPRQVDGGMWYTRRLVSGVLQTIGTNEIDTVVLPGVSASSALTGDATDQIARRAECDAVVVNGQPGYTPGPSILLPIAGGLHSGVATDVAARLAAAADAWIDILHVVPDEASETERKMARSYVNAAYNRIARPETTSTWIFDAADPIDAIIEQSRYYLTTVIGAPTKGRLRRFVSGSKNKTIRSNAQSVVLSARNNTETQTLTGD